MAASLTKFGKFAILNWIMVWLIILTGMLMVLPGEMVGTNVSKWILDRNVFWVTGLIIGISYFISHAIIIICSVVFSNVATKSMAERMHSMVACLDFTEKAVLREFVIQRKSVINLPTTEPAVKNLLSSGILTYAYGKPCSGDDSIIKALMISLEARQYITYKVLGLNKTGMSEEQVEQILSERPKFVAKSLSRS